MSMLADRDRKCQGRSGGREGEGKGEDDAGCKRRGGVHTTWTTLSCAQHLSAMVAFFRSSPQELEPEGCEH